MRQNIRTRGTSSEKAVKDIRRATRKQYSAEEKIRIVLDGLRGEEAVNLNVMSRLRPDNSPMLHISTTVPMSAFGGTSTGRRNTFVKSKSKIALRKACPL